MRPIDGDEVLDYIATMPIDIGFEDAERIEDYIKSMPTIGPERTTGEWIDDGDPATWVCECCGYRVFRYNNTSFCPNCGAKME